MSQELSEAESPTIGENISDHNDHMYDDNVSEPDLGEVSPISRMEHRTETQVTEMATQVKDTISALSDQMLKLNEKIENISETNTRLQNRLRTIEGHTKCIWKK